jgi:UDP-glucose 4-epimerase
MNKAETSRRCLVLGGLGFMGSHLVDALLSAGHYVRCFDRPHVTPLGDSHSSDPNYELYEGDLLSEADVIEALEGCDVCYHFVSTTLPKSSNADPVFDVESNVLGTLRLLTHAVKSGIKKVIFISSGGTVYGVPRQVPIPESHPTDPVCSYGITKLAIEKYLGLFRKIHGLDYTVLRISNPYGERQRTQASQGAVSVFLGKVLRDEPVEIWGDGSVVRDYIYIADVVDALLAALNQTDSEHVFNIGSGCGLSLNEVLDYIGTITGRKAVRHYTLSRAFDVPKNVLSIERAKLSLGWSPKVDFEQGLRKYADWLSQHL